MRSGLPVSDNRTFSLGVTVKALRANIDWKSAFLLERGQFQMEGVAPTNRSSCQKTSINVLSCGIRMWAQVSFVLSQSTRLADGRTDGRTDRHLAHDYTVRCITRSRTVKTETSTIFATVAVLFLREIWSLTYLFIYAVAQSVWLIFKSSIRARARLRHEVPFIKSWSAVSSSAQEHSGSVVRNGCQCSCHLSLGAVSPRVKNKRHLAADNHFHVAVVAASTYWRLWADKGAVIRYVRSLSLYRHHHHFICS